MAKKKVQMKVLGSSGYDDICPVPAEHASSHGKNGTDQISPVDIGAQSEIPITHTPDPNVNIWIDPDEEGEGGGGVDIPAQATEPATGNYWLDTSAEGGTYYTAGEVDALLSGLNRIQMELLWENASPTSDFAAQDIIINEMANSKEGDWIVVETVKHGIFFTCWSAKENKYCFMSYAFYNGSAVEGKRRTWYVIGSRVNFSNNSSWTSSSTSTSNSFFVPNKIYRIKCIA